jgi:hypothetical protein
MLFDRLLAVPGASWAPRQFADTQMPCNHLKRLARPTGLTRACGPRPLGRTHFVRASVGRLRRPRMIRRLRRLVVATLLRLSRDFVALGANL